MGSVLHINNTNIQGSVVSPINCKKFPNVGYTVPSTTVKQYNQTGYIVGGGPSLEFFNWSLLDEKFVVGINTAYRVLPNAQIIYFTDDDWYELHKPVLLNHNGIKIKGSLNPAKYAKDSNIRQMCLIGEKGLSVEPHRLFHGRNSPYAATNMLIQWGFKYIYYLGLDMSYGRPDATNKTKKKTHWHEGHRRIDGEGSYAIFKENYKILANLAPQCGVTITNINLVNRLEMFHFKTYVDHFGSSWTKAS